jgi:nucleoside-diphosphate-sugar epimerase
LIVKNILITGGAGFIGSMLATNLLRAGYNVTVLDKLLYESNSIDHLFNYPNFAFYKKDVNNFSFVKKILKKFDLILPLAALVGAPLCEKKKQEAIKTNFESIRNLVNSLESKQKIIFLTTNSGYGIGEKGKFCDEHSPLKPISLYGKTKCDAENIVSTHANSISFRLATVFGISYRMRSDLLVNNFAYRAVNFKKLTIYEPHFRRNYINIQDVVSAIIFSINNFNKMKNNVYNLGLSTANITKIELAKLFKKKLNISILIKNDKTDPDKRDYFVSNKKIEAKGWEAKISLDEGVTQLIKYFQYSKYKKNINIINNY